MKLFIIVVEAGIAAIDVDHQWAAYTLRGKRGIFSALISALNIKNARHRMLTGIKRKAGGAENQCLPKKMKKK